MSSIYPDIDPYENGFLEVGGNEFIYWEICGNSEGKPARWIYQPGKLR